MKRPTGFAILSFVMAWLGIAALMNAWLALTRVEPPIPRFLSPVMAAYGIAALATMVGLWKMRPWVLIALKSWMGICGLFMLSFGIYFKSLMQGGILGLLGFLIFVSVLFGFLYGYVEKNLRKAV